MPAGGVKVRPLAIAAPLKLSVSTTIEIGLEVLPTWALPLSAELGRRGVDHAGDSLRGGAAEGQGLGIVAALEDQDAGIRPARGRESG